MTRTWLLFLAIGLFGTTACQPDDTSGGSASNEPALRVTETSKEFDDYVLHFNAQTTDQLPTVVAMEHGITRSTNRGMLTVSVLKKEPGTMGAPVSADVQASAVNLTGQLKALTVRSIREQQANYYIAATTIANEETLIFTIDVIPENETETLSVRFMKQFFVD